MKNKIMGIILAAAMMMVLGACGGSGASDAESDAGAAGAEEVVTDMPSAEVKGEESGITQMPDFETIDLEGNTYDRSVFSQADITVVNFWGTFCPPCIDEMPELAAWSSELPENVQIIGIVVDVPSEFVPEYETAKELVAETGVTYTNLIASDQFGGVFNHLIGVPTTFFVDSEGKVLCEEIIGADVDAYKKTVEDLL